MKYAKKYVPMVAIATAVGGGVVWAAFNIKLGRKIMGDQTLSNKIWGKPRSPYFVKTQSSLKA